MVEVSGMRKHFPQQGRALKVPGGWLQGKLSHRCQASRFRQCPDPARWAARCRSPAGLWFLSIPGARLVLLG